MLPVEYVMTFQQLDHRRGSLPDIRANDESITFRIPLAGFARSLLVIRCDTDGEVWISIADGGQTDAAHD